ncbi:hypothetical protein PFISCL1PPCAC_3422, partial [Pristionchus fissidentatus]
AMSGLIRRIRRTNKKAAKYQFTATLQELHLTAADPDVHPKAVVVSFQHRRRTSSSKERTWEKSFTNPSQAVIVWPEQTPDTIEILTTLFKASDGALEDKEWTIVVDEITAKNRRRPIAAVPLNMRLFIHDHPGSRSQLKLKLRPLSPQITHASMVLTLAANLVNDGFRDDMSLTSSCSGRATREQSVVDGVGVDGDTTVPPVDGKAVEEIARVSDEIEKNFGQKTAEEKSEPIRPHWRVPSPPVVGESGKGKAGEEKKDKGGREPPVDPIKQQQDRLPTELFFEVDKDSHPVQMPAPPPSSLMMSSIHMRGRSPRASTRDRELREWRAPPEKIEGEDVMEWCQRVAAPYAPTVKINDFTKSFQSGLALCALVHAFRPELIGEFDHLDFSMTTTGKRSNVEKALAAATSLGVQSVPEEHFIITPDKKEIKLLVERLRRLLERSTELPTPISISDHRISTLYPVNDDEKGVIAEMVELQKGAKAHQRSAYSGVTPEDKEFARTTLEREKKEKKQRTALSYDTFVPPEKKEEVSATVPLPEQPTVPVPPTTVPSSTTVSREGMTSPSQSREAHDPFASSSGEEKEREEESDSPKDSNGVEGRGGGEGEEEVDGDATRKDKLRDMTIITPTTSRKLSSTREEYREKARKMLADPQAAIGEFRTPTTDAAPAATTEDRRRDAARLLSEAQSDGATFVIHSNNHHHHHRAAFSSSTTAAAGAPLQPTPLRKFPSRTSLGGSNTDLRRVELVQPSPIVMHKFTKRDPSPAMSRKIYDNGETPHVPAISASREDVSSRVVNVVTSFRRHGSMRADELKDMMSNFAQKYATGTSSTPSTPSIQRSANVMSTPTRKVTSQWEMDVEDEERTTREQETIAEELLRITGEIKHREAVIRDAGLVAGSEEEEKLVGDLVRLANEKNGLVVKQEYYNVIENLRESMKRSNKVKSELDAMQTYCKTEEEMRRKEQKEREFVTEVEIKNDLMQRLFAAEDKMSYDPDEEFTTNSLNRSSLQASGNFVRGAPVSASKRIAQGIQSWLQG